MSLSINNTQPAEIISKQPSFKGKWDKTEQGNPYYKTNSSAIAGGIMAVPAAVTWLSNLSLPTTEEQVKSRYDKIKDSFIKTMGKENAAAFNESIDKGLQAEKDNILKQIEKNKKIKAWAVPFAILAAGLTAGCGLIVDNLRNKKAQEAADKVKQIGVKQAVMQDDKIQLSNKGRAYYESNQGSKYGALLGAGCGIISSAMSLDKKPGNYIANAILFALGGLIMGKIADSNSNKDARKHA